MVIYWIVVGLVLVLGMLMPQTGPDKKLYVRSMFIVHAFVCGCKYSHLTGDLMKYHSMYIDYYSKYSLFSPQIIGSLRNVLWNVVNKIIGILSGYNFQIFLIILAIVTEYCVARFILKYSPCPWISFLVWNCMSLYFYGFHQIKQALAMSILLLAAEGLMEKDRKKFYIWTIIAGLIHGPAMAFLPMYWFTKRRVDKGVIAIYVLLAVLIVIFRHRLIADMADVYYETGVGESIVSAEETHIGIRFFIILFLLFVGLAIKGLQNENFKKMFLLVGVAAVFQFCSVFGNIFTRYADYFFQFSIVYMPMLCYADRGNELTESSGLSQVFQLDESARETLIVGMVAALLIWYYLTGFRGVSTTSVDTLLKYKFFWQV